MNVQSEQRKRRKRTANYTIAEKKLLLNVVKMHNDIINNPGNTTEIASAKRNAWKQVTLMFNTKNDGNEYRNPVHLKNLYKQLKMFHRRQKTNQQSFLESSESCQVETPDRDDDDFQCLLDTLKDESSGVSNYSHEFVKSETTKPTKPSKYSKPISLCNVEQKLLSLLDVKIQLASQELEEFKEAARLRMEREREEFETKCQRDKQLFLMEYQRESEQYELEIAKLRVELKQLQSSAV